MNPGEILHTTAKFVPPNKPKSDKGGKTMLVLGGSFLIAVMCSVVGGSAGVLLPAWGVVFLVGYGAFVSEGQ